jgi:hypothetical protein
MQLIEGQNLAAVIDGLRRRTGEGGPPAPGPESTGPYPPAPEAPPGADTRPALGPQFSTLHSARPGEMYRTAARLIAQAAEGLEYAHQTGVIHRDVKPANLLVDARGNVWLTDFGLASVHADAGLTQTGDLLGTLRYMSPEQAGGQRVLIDHRTDVYSLGATLYELLTLRPIFDGADRQTLLRQILNEEPRAPRAVDPAVPAELETIVLKALSKPPAERYATAGEFAEDLHRFLRYEPIRARRATLGQRARKWLRRHPSVLVAGAVLLVLLSAGSLAAAWVIRGEREKAEHAYQQERRRNQEAEDRFRLAQRAVDDLVRLAAQELADKPSLEGLRIRMLESALAYYQELIEQRGDDPEAQEHLAETRSRVKSIIDDLTVVQGNGDLNLLQNPAVIDALRPSDEQRHGLDQLLSRLPQQRDEQFHDFFRLSPDDWQKKLLGVARANDTAIREALSPAQLSRLKQIALQARGLWAFQDAQVADALKLTAAQREKIRAIGAKAVAAPPMGGRGWGRGGPGPRGRGRPFDRGPWKEDEQRMRKEHERKMKAAYEEALELLTSAQAKRWREITGEPVEGLTPGCPPGPPPGLPFGPPGAPHQLDTEGPVRFPPAGVSQGQGNELP